MATWRGRFLIPGVVIAFSVAPAGADKLASDRAAAGNGVGASITAVRRGGIGASPRSDLLEPAASPRPMPADPDFGIERFPAFDDRIDAPPVPREPKTKSIRILTDSLT
jgi:hypothetical protein